ncbi:hypothetical protein lerEdw1_003489 [Lerista edwardsae]|nr:hypothetical protein lerEdw1_003489 [Lerista edwardsae]
MDPTGPQLFVLSLLLASVQLCEIPQGNSHLIKALNVDLLSQIEDVSEGPNPSIYLALRLSADHNLARESEYLQTLRTSSPQRQSNTGWLALYLLALRATCHDMETPESRRLVTRLKSHLHKEKQQIGPEDSGHPVTNYYQYSLGVLALCVHNKRVDIHVIAKLLHAEKHGMFTHNSKLSVDTEAMAGLAFSCLEKNTSYPQRVMKELEQGVQRLKEKILQAQTPEGYFGNVYSSPLAMQFLIAAGVKKKPECSTGMAALLQGLKQGDFQNTLVGSQLLPALYGKSYVDVSGIHCQSDGEALALSTPSPEPRVASQESQMIAVHLMARSPPGHLPLYNELLTVPAGSSLLDVLKVAEKQAANPFRFETQMTLSGPLLTSVMGVRAQDGERKYWRLLRVPYTTLEQGIADYIPQDGESILLQFSPW